ncbi:ABC transporter permease subunit, partial [archaeon]|nr:ABC transporter permease subunit [archaeon]
MPKTITKSIISSEALQWASSIILCFAFWVILAIAPNTARYIPSPVALVNTLIGQSDVLLQHLTSTAISAVIGFTYGGFAAILSTLIAILWPTAKRGFSLLSIVLYSIPLIAAAPVAALLFGTKNSGAVLGCIGAYLPIFLSGLRAGDRISDSFSDLIKGYGASKYEEIRLVRLPLVVRGWIVGAQSGWIWAVLGALLGDFTGGRWGLGTFLVGSLSRGEPTRVWAIVVLCLALSAAGLFAIRGLGKLLRLHSSVDVLDASLP